MARPLRIEFKGALYHVTSRGNEKREIFYDDKDRRRFLDILSEVNKRFNWLCHAYCLMKNHYHLLIETPEGNLSKGMRQLNGVYTQYFNRRHNRAGHLLQGRYRSILVDKQSYLLEVARYIVLNPVRAGLVKRPDQWKWSSFNATAYQRRPHSCLNLEWILSQFSRRVRDAGRRYREFVYAGVGQESIWLKLKGQVLLGSEEFIGRFIDIVREKKGQKEVPRSQRFLNRPGLEEIFSPPDIRDREKRNRRIMDAILKYGYSQAEVARHLGVHYSTVSKVLKENSRFKT